MSWITRAALIGLLGISLVGCVGGGTNLQRMGLLRVGDTKAAVLPPMGILWSRVKAPVAPGAPKKVGVRRGEATVNQIALPPLPAPGLTFGTPLFSWGDASVEEAVRNGGLQNVSHVDYQLTTFLMVYRRFKLIAYGD